MAKANHFHVVRGEKGWDVKSEGSGRPIGHASTQAVAQEVARRHAIATQGEVITHGRDGNFRSRDSYGPDPANRPG